ncbi:MAG: glycoside hydrolase family 1 protein [Anaerolineae bacterium]|nr:glycoside hydrolase family 1 protein [Anaerolineae bacterium]
MPQATFTFPKGFLWGTATASHQVEGGNNNNNWAIWEDTPGKIIGGHRSGRACDWWCGKRWKEDFDRAAETGQNTHRLSIEWSRVQPAADRWDEDAINYYREIVRGMTERKLMPMVTLHHFTDPIWFYEQGGWEMEDAPGLYARYVEKVVEALKEYVSVWVTINEPNVYTLNGYVEGAFPPGKKDVGAAFGVYCNLVRAHAQAYRIIHKIQPQARVGFAHHYRSVLPARSWSPFDRLAAKLVFESINVAFPGALLDGRVRLLGKQCRVPEAIGTQDFFGLNYYTRTLVAFVLDAKQFFQRSFFPPGVEVSPTGFLANVPEGFYEAMRWATRFNVPILITENGVEDNDDRLRPSYLVEHVHQVWRALNNNFQIKGYYHWSLVDNFEWERGWTQRFGLWGLNPESQSRLRRPSVDLYAAICRENALSSAMVEKFAPRSFARLFPV